MTVNVKKYDYCPVCLNTTYKILFSPVMDTFVRFRRLSRIKYQSYLNGWEKELLLEVCECAFCGHLWHHFQPDQFSLFEMYEKAQPIKPRGYSKKTIAYIKKQLDAVYCIANQNGKIKPCMLDYGSGSGAWAKAASEVGFEVYAYEPSINRSVTDKKPSEFTIINSIDKIKEKRFDVINLEQVLEHVQQPIETLRSLKTFCHETSILRITVPNIGKLVKRDDFWDDFPFNGKTVHPMSPYEHLQGFSSQSFFLALKRSGLKQVALRRFTWSNRLEVAKRIMGTIFPKFKNTRAIAEFIK
jgi:SAM-dependent methyltransferase